MTDDPKETEASKASVWHPVLKTYREEIAATCRDPRHVDALGAAHADELACWIEAEPETTISQVAIWAGYYVVEGGDYWDALVLAAERFFKAQPPR